MAILKIRLSVMFVLLVVAFFIAIFFINKSPLSAGALALFSVNTFLLAFYISPIISGQKARIDELGKITHAEALLLYKVIMNAHSLPKRTYHEFKQKIDSYISSRIDNSNPLAGEKEYEELISYCIDYDGKDKDIIHNLEASLIDNQTNRSNLNAGFRNVVYSHEWIVILILFSVSMFFILQIDFGKSLFLHFVDALLASGLTLILLILEKLSTLTHKKAKHIYDTYKKLLATDFREID